MQKKEDQGFRTMGREGSRGQIQIHFMYKIVVYVCIYANTSFN